MKRTFLAVCLLLSLLFIISGCSVVSKVLPKKCPASCDDTNVCTRDACGKETNYQCVSTTISPCDGNQICEDGEYLSSTDCPSCDDSNACTTDTYSYAAGACGHESVPNCCGNNVCEAGETSASCADCPTCDDNNACTKDSFDRDSSLCVNSIIVPCCGNTRCESGEVYATCKADCQPSKQDQISLCGANETCVSNLAVKFKDSAICQSALSVSGTNECYLALALAQNRSGYCSYITDEAKNLRCQEEYAVAFSSPSNCPLVIPNRCLERIAVKTGDAQLCTHIIEQNVATRDDFVLKCQAQVSRDYLLCKQIAKVWIADSCYADLAVATKDISLCQAVQLDKDSCEFYVQDSLGYPSG